MMATILPRLKPVPQKERMLAIFELLALIDFNRLRND